MADLFNNFPSWGESGEYPPGGFFYQGGDQVNEKHMDALWDGVQTHITNINDAVRDRVRNLDGDVVLDSGLVASQGSGTREVDVTASSAGAFVDGQFTGSVSADTTSHTANGTGSTRTDVVWVDVDGNVDKTEDQTTVASDRMKIAEVDINTSDSITDVRNYARDHVHNVASENAPDSPESGDFWHDLTDVREKVRQDGDWRTIITEEDDITITAGDGLDGSDTVDLVGGATLTPSVDVTDLLGVGITEDGSNNFELDESVITDGGPKEIDADELSGSNGDDGEVLQTDGSDAFWAEQEGIYVDDNDVRIVDSVSGFDFRGGITAEDIGSNEAAVNAKTAVAVSQRLGRR